MPAPFPGPVRRIFSPRLVVVVFLLLVAAPGLAAEEHHWRKLEVWAKVEADGSIVLRERQHMVFSGDLNGGERIFRLLTRQRLDFRGITRIDEQGGVHPLTENDELVAVDQYSFVGSDVLRWRSRLPGDPTFDNTLLVYELDYQIRNAVVGAASEGAYRLDHEFVFTDRSGVVEEFHLDLEVDPSWRVVGDWRRHHEGKGLQPGQGYQVELDLEWVGAGAAPVIQNPQPYKPVLLLLLGVVAAGMVYLWRDFRQKQAAIGRFDPLPTLPPGEEIAWILRFRPEEIGALWDRSVGPPEVAALMARWVSEGKLRTRVEEAPVFLGFGKKTILHLELLVDRDSNFVSHEYLLINGFFFGGRTQVNTEEIRKHYKNSGFDPAGLIRKGLEDRLEAHPEWKEKATRAPAKKPTLLLVLAGFVGLFLSLVVDVEATIFSLPLIFLFIPVYAISAIAALMNRGAIEKVGLRIGLISIPPILFFLAMSIQVLVSPIVVDPTFSYSPGYFVVLGFGLLLLGVYRSVLNIASSRESREGIGTRKWLAAARRYLQHQLSQESPAFGDAMFPYLMAFGLDEDVDYWFQSFGGGSTLARQDRYRSTGGGFSAGGSSSPSSAGGGFTGGGGLFGGGGASASWAVAATSMAAGVASASSSGGSSSGGGGSSSSGGGGGGAW